EEEGHKEEENRFFISYEKEVQDDANLFEEFTLKEHNHLKDQSMVMSLQEEGEKNEETIKKCSMFICFITDGYFNDSQSMKDLKVAYEAGIKLVPIQVSTKPVSFEKAPRELKHVDTLLENPAGMLDVGKGDVYYRVGVDKLWRIMGLDVLKNLFTGFTHIKFPRRIQEDKAAKYVPNTRVWAFGQATTWDESNEGNVFIVTGNAG
ncbi:MAG: hypothetical protein GY816_07125, partial [Cytophagales bacterium]|nr:hypothetical protein [Cytophagales bacterium]